MVVGELVGVAGGPGAVEGADDAWCVGFEFALDGGEFGVEAVGGAV